MDLTIDRWEKEGFGPILFTEANIIFLREIKLGDDITIELYLEGIVSKR